MTKKDATEEKKTRATPKRLTPKQWGEAEALWEAGEMTGASLAAKFGVTESAILQHMKRAGKKRGAKAEESKKRVAEEVTSAALQDASVLAARIRETKEDHYKMAAGIAKLAWGEVIKARQNEAPMATITNNVKALDSAMNVLAKARMERYAVLGLDKEVDSDDEGLPGLLIEELTADQIEELRARDFNAFDELDEEGEQDPDDAVTEES